MLPFCNENQSVTGGDVGVGSSYHIVVVHVFGSGRRCLLSEVDVLERAIGTSHKHEATTANAAVIHPDHTDTQHSRDQAVSGVATLLEHVDTDVGAYRALRRNRAEPVALWVGGSR